MDPVQRQIFFVDAEGDVHGSAVVQQVFKGVRNTLNVVLEEHIPGIGAILVQLFFIFTA